MNERGLFFTSDTHFGHKGMVEKFGRKFASVDEMDEAIIRRWNETVPKNGSVYHLGDLSFRGVTRTCEILDRLNGTKYLIMGNHDHPSASLKERFEWVRDYSELVVVEEVSALEAADPEFKPKEQRIVMCHYAFRVWNRAHQGAWNLHGHSHGNLGKIGGQLDVGADTHDLRPYSYLEVKEAIPRYFVPVDHHEWGTACRA